MLSKKCVSAIAITALMLLSSAMLFMSQKADAASWLTTSDTDFAPGHFFTGTGFETELHGTGADAYVQNKKDMTNWLQKMPGTNTGPRSQFGFANDSAEGRFILFGGLDGISSWRNDTWEYNYAAENWEKICDDNTPACAPPKRLTPSMAYDNNSKVVVMYGGLDTDGFILSDTWEYNVNTNQWTNTTNPGNSPRGMGGHRLVYDAKDKRVILVGRGVSSMEVWAYNAVDNTWANMNTIGGPSQRSGYALGYSYEANHQRVVLFGGGEVMTLYDETWEYNYGSNSWSQANPTNKPTARTGAQMTYNFKQSIEGLILWGGNSWSTETWRYSYASGSADWSMVMTTTAPTPGRTNYGLAYDPGYNALIIYGGEPFSGPRLNDTWFLESGYRLEGRYYTKFLNTYSTGSQWFHIFFNVTTEPNTQARFQAEATNTCDEGAPTNFSGPNGLSSQYYTTSGQDLWVGLSPNKCFRWMADLITFDPSVAPKLLDVSIDYNATKVPPKVETYSPIGAGHPINSHIYINFTKPMDTSNVWVFVWKVIDSTNVTLDRPFTWTEGNSKVEITHNTQPFLEAKAYRVRVYGADTDGETLDYTAGYHQWAFTTISIPPKIMSTVPAPNSIDVALNAPVVITFSEPMNTSSCWPYVTIDPLAPPGLAFDGHSWGVGDTQLTLTHSLPFAQFTTFTVDVPMDPSKPCQDKSDILWTFGPTAVPWPFTTLAINPFITITDPMNLEAEVLTTTSITATFSRDMNPSAFYYTFKEWDVPTLSWKNWTGGTFSSPTWAGRKVTLAHTTAFGNCKPYRVEMWALDTAGNSLITNPNVPNPWKFMTVGPSGVCGPFMIFTSPSDAEENVPLWKNVTIIWYFTPPDTGGMNPSTFSFTLKDQYSNDLTSHFTPNWIGMGPSAVELLHPTYLFDPCQKYTVRVTAAKDNANRNFIPGPAENPFSFKTIATECPPIVTWAQPTNGTLDVPLNTDIKYRFSVPMDPLTVNILIRPLVNMNAPVWSEGNSNVTVTHDAFSECTWYNLTVFGSDTGGHALGRGPVPNPIQFRAHCPISGTYITDTYPANGQTDIPLTASIWVNFSDPMDTNSLTFTLTPGSITFTQFWYPGAMTVRLDHTTPYAPATVYTARVVTARNQSGGDIVGGGAPNPWTFRSYAPKPYIVSTIPVNGATDIVLDSTITVIFDKPMDTTSVTFSTSPAHTYTQQWTNAQTVVFGHSTPFVFCTDYTATVIDARDTLGTHLGPGPVPNPWTFRTTCQFQVKGLKVTRQAPNVRLDWTGDAQVQFWNVFHSNDRLAPWPWAVIYNITTPGNNFYVHTNAISDMLNHFYIVRGFKLGGWSANSTMGALWHPTLAPNPGRPSAFWFSLPYNSWYKKAKDISNELGYQKINVVARFDPARQQTVVWYYTHGAWRGTNFDITAGDGLMIGVVSNFDWAINGTDKIISMVFTYRMQLRTNIYRIGLPYTNGLASASELVTAIAGGIGPGTGSKIIAVGKWVYPTQSSRVYSYTAAGWSGDNFDIVPGDGLWVEIASSFSWNLTLITPEVP